MRTIVFFFCLVIMHSITTTTTSPTATTTTTTTITIIRLSLSCACVSVVRTKERLARAWQNMLIVVFVVVINISTVTTEKSMYREAGYIWYGTKTTFTAGEKRLGHISHPSLLVSIGRDIIKTANFFFL